MATPAPSANPTVVTVVKGDTLWGIARDYLGNGAKFYQLATLNGLKYEERNGHTYCHLYVGQQIKLTKNATSGGSGSGSGTASSSSQTANTNQATITAFGLQSDADNDNTLFAVWSWSKDNTESYAVSWEYCTGDKKTDGSLIWFIGNSTSQSVDKNNPNASTISVYSFPNNAKQIRFRVKPIAKNKGSKNDTPYWTANWTSYKTYTNPTFGAPEVPSGLQVEIDKFKLTATLDNLSKDTTKVEFRVIKDNKTVFKSGTAATVSVTTGHAAYTCTVNAGGEYKVHCRAYNSSGVASEWSAYSDNKKTIPLAPARIIDVQAKSETSVYLKWEASNTAVKYDIEYATEKSYFDKSNGTVIESDIKSTEYELLNLSSGDEYFFRVRAVNEQGESDWSEIVSVTIGKAPAAPTTWSSVSTAVVGEELILYWVHNSEDGSSQTYANLQIYVGDEEIPSVDIDIKNSEDEEEKDKTSFYVVNTANYVDTSIKWRVRTAGIAKQEGYGDWSIMREVQIHTKPSLDLSLMDIDNNMIDILTAFPLRVYAVPSPNTQAPIGYYLSVTANESYESVDRVGNVKIVSSGDEVYGKYFDTTDKLLVDLSASNIDLENGITYTIECTVSMDSGLTAVASSEITVSWVDAYCEPNAEVTVDDETFVAYIRPYCETTTLTQYKVNHNGSTYTLTNEEVSWMYGDPVVDAYIDESGEQVYTGVTVDGDEVYYAIVETSELVDGVVLSVYRREFDGSFTELETNITNNRYTTITDPHPALDLARYRIVATTTDTGAVSYTDLSGYPVNGIAVVLQWAEDWSTFDTIEDAELVQPAWTGSMLKLPYNIDVSDNYSPDVDLVEYIGRSHPISYYGTQKGSSATWNIEIPKDDEETLYGLRRLAKWMGDVYVREPSGSGYWANVNVSFSQKHCELTIPVTLNIKRVEGGI